MKREKLELTTQAYARQIVTKMNKDTDVEQIDVQMKLSVMKPLHASWLIELYNYKISSAGREMCMKRWEKSGIYNAAIKGINGLPSLDTFKILWLRTKT